MEIQSDLNVLSMWSDDAAQQLKITVDSDVLDGIVGQMAAANRGTAAGVITGNINLGVKGTPLSWSPRTRASGDIELLDVLMRMGRCSTSRTSRKSAAGSSCRRGLAA
jgi:hypothetical protein